MTSNSEISDGEFCNDCGDNNLQKFQKYCRRCGAKNPTFEKPLEKLAEPTQTEIKLARRLFSEGIRFILSPEIWYSSCTFYTPDFLIENKLIVEIDGGYHRESHQVLMDRIRQRAIQNSGYPVCRFTNKEVNKSLENVVKSISLQLGTLKAKSQTSIIEVNVPKENRLSNIPIDILRKQTHELHELTFEKNWTPELFKNLLFKFSPIPNKCAMQTMMLMLLGLNLRSKNGVADFQQYSKLFEKVTSIMGDFFGKLAIVEFTNEFNITATNFLKNLVFDGKPKILNHRIISIQNYSDIQDLIKNFNLNFSKLGVVVMEDDLKIECMHEKKKRLEMLKKKTMEPSSILNRTESKISTKFDWIDKWDNCDDLI